MDTGVYIHLFVIFHCFDFKILINFNAHDYVAIPFVVMSGEKPTAVCNLNS